MAWLTAQIPSDLHDAMKRIADANDRSVSAEVRLAVREHVKEHDPEPMERAA